MMRLQIHNSPNGRQQSVDQSKVDIEIQQDEDFLSPTELAEIWARRAYELAEEPPAPATGQTVDLLVFWLGDERYGLEVTGVREIYPLEQLTPVPRTPDFVAGVFSARGRILSVIDLRAFLGLPALSLSDQTKIIVVTNTNPTPETNQMEIGILADEVTDVITIFKEDIEPPLTTHASAQARHLQGVTSDMLVVLNLATLLQDERLVIYEEIM
jgi:purine-binding chemotaxis protein CheW